MRNPLFVALLVVVRPLCVRPSCRSPRRRRSSSARQSRRVRPVVAVVALCPPARPDCPSRRPSELLLAYRRVAYVGTKETETRGAQTTRT